MVKHRGMTLVEILLALAIFGIIITAVYSVFGTSMRSYFNIEDDIALQKSAQEMLNKITDDISTTKTIVEATVSTFTFVNAKGESVRYEISGDKILRNGGQLNPEKIGVINLEFNYFGNAAFLDENKDGVVDMNELDRNQDGELTDTELTDISLVRIKMKLKKKNQQMELSSSVKLWK